MTDLIPKAAQDVAEINPDEFIVPGMENVQPGELRIPLLKLVQGTSRMDGAQAHIGQWHNSVTGEFLDAPELLIIGIAKGRVMFPGQFSADNKPLCASNDGALPRPEFVGLITKIISVNAVGEPAVMTVTIPDKCADCPFSKWGDAGAPPRCNEVSTFAGLDENGLPCLVQLRSTGMRNAPALKTMLAANGIRKTIRLGSIQETNDSGTYAVATFVIGEKLTKDWQRNAIRLVQTVGNLAVRNQQAAMEQPEQPGYNGGGASNPGAPPMEEDDLPF